MFPFDADCSYCRELNSNDEYKGKFYCSKKKQYVSARGSRCSMASEVMGRSDSEKKRLRDISKAHGYYVITAISNILGLDNDNEYMSAFVYLRDVIMPASDEYKSFIDDYETDGPALASLLSNDEGALDYAEYLRVTYLNGVVSLFCQDRVFDAVSLYTSMLDAMKARYGYVRKSEKAAQVLNYSA